MVTRAIENAQKKVEGHNFDIRKNLLEYDDVMNQQRKTIYALRRRVIGAEVDETKEMLLDQIQECIIQMVGRAPPCGAATRAGRCP